MLKLTTFALMAMVCACHAQGTGGEAASPEPLRPAGVDAVGSGVPAPGSLAFGSAEAAVTARLGAPTAHWEESGFQWRRFAVGTTEVSLGFYRDKLGQVRLKPAAPLAWPQAAAWARALLPAFDASRLDKSKPASWTYFEAITVDRLPFEAGLTFAQRDGLTVAIDGEMNWLD